MTGKTLGVAFSLLLLSSLIQGLPNPEVIRNEAREAEVGQNISLPCLIKNVTGLQIVNIEWKREETKLGVYSPWFGHHLFWSNVSIQILGPGTDKAGSYLFLPGVNKWDSGIYVCVIATYPFGSIRKETTLTVKDSIKIVCDTDDVIQVSYGGNASVHCSVHSDAQYRWTKDEKTVSENESLELWWVTDAQAGPYHLTVKTGDKTLHRGFIITVLTAATSPRTDPATTLSQALTDSAHSSVTTLQTTELSTPVTWTIPLNLSDVTVPDVEIVTSWTSLPPTSVPPSPGTHSNTYPSLNFTTSSHATAASSSTQESVSEEMRNKSRPHTPKTGDFFSVSTEEVSTMGNVSERSENPSSTPREGVTITVSVTINKGTSRTHLMVALLVVSLLLVVVVVGFLYWRQIRQERLDLPPPFKPPPVPVKYTAARWSEASLQTFPTSRCNSIAASSDARQSYI